MNLPLFNDSETTFSGVCLDQITVKFPQYPLKRIVEEIYTKSKGITQEICCNEANHIKSFFHGHSKC